MDHYIIAIGGTGQLILHYYAQLYLLGVVRENFRAVVIDADDLIQSLGFLEAGNRNGLFALARTALGRTLAEQLVPRIEFVKLAPENASDRVFQALGAPDPAAAGAFSHPAQGMFLGDTLLQTVSKGLYSRPCISAVLGLDRALQALGAGAIENDTRIAVVCSCIGGTGGGLGVPVLSHLQQIRRTDVSLRLVLLGRYFEATQDAIAGEYDRFESNKLMFVRALKEFVPGLHSFCYVEEPRMRGRLKEEDKAMRLPWPDSPEQPYWRAVCGLYHLLDETRREARGDFESREVAAKDFQPAVDLDLSRKRLDRGLARVESALGHSVIQRIASEALPRFVWGERLDGFLRTYWRAVRDAAKGDARTMPNLGRAVQQAAARLWKPQGGNYGVRELFPDVPASPASPSEIRRVAWPHVAIETAGFENPESAARLIAAAFLFSCLRFGE